LGKRKRPSPDAQLGANDGEDDELSPDREEMVRSIEKSRRVVGTVSPIREEVDNAPDELSILEENATPAFHAVFARSGVTKRTPPPVLAQTQVPSGGAQQTTPHVNASGGVSVASRQSTSRRSKSTDPGPATPSLAPNRPPRSTPASRIVPTFETPAALPDTEEESEDELSPQVAEVNGTTPRVVGKDLSPNIPLRDETAMDVDELSPPKNPTPARDVPAVEDETEREDTRAEEPEEQVIAPAVKRGRPKRVVEVEEDVAPMAAPVISPEQPPVPLQPAKRGRPRRVIEDEEDAVSTVAPTKPVQRGRPRKEVLEKDVEAQSTPAARGPRKGKGGNSIPEEMEEVDELSPDRDRTLPQPAKSATRNKHVEISSAQEESEPEPEEEPEPTPVPRAKRQSPKQVQRIKSTTEKPSRKRQKFLGPKHAISVMRIKGSSVRGITVADTTRTILEETIDSRLNRMAEKLQTCQNSDRRKELRSEINLSISFKESLNEKLLDLQDANDVLSTNFKKMKLFKRDKAELRKEILTIQNNRQDIALEQDDVQAEFEAEKARMDARNSLSENMFNIEAAIRSGREKARKEGRDNEGPVLPLGMLLDTVGRDVGSHGGGLLANVKGFNGLLERAAGWLEGRA
jgi:hypothetical protein